ncbi:MAG TPA: VanW family protein [Patescibacteria group bacterium]|nr:VanW family protein [Patescibacteria group bacterium]
MVRATRSKKKRRVGFLLAFYFVLIAVVSPILYFQLAFFNRIHPGLSVAGVYLGGLTQEEASKELSQKISPVQDMKLVNSEQVFDIRTKDFDFRYNYTESALRAFNFTRTGNIFFDLAARINLMFQPKNLGFAVELDEEKLSKVISVVSGQDFVDPVNPSIKLVGGQIRVSKGTAGREIDQNSLRSLIGKNLAFADSSDVMIPIKVNDPSLSDLGLSVAKARGEKFIGKNISAKFEYETFTFKDADLVGFLNPHGGYKEDSVSESIGEIAEAINREPQNPKFTFDGAKVSEFQPALEGIETDREKFKESILNAVRNIEDGQDSLSFDIPVLKTPPAITTDKVNNLGIKELLGRGTSTYYHSIPSRVHNVVLAASRINGTLIAPGEEFSFNETLGDVSQFTGYKQAYIISEGKTILGDGGGVCQVSTTLFRALLNSGIRVTDRTAHAYRVGYYEQGFPPGLDATVYGPSPDLKFKNDTPGHILIQARSDPKRYSLTFELYGTSDGRSATISKPVVSNVTAPPEDLYQDDPTLPAGTVKQIDYKAWGAKVTFTYKVVRGDEILINRTFTSNYRPWQAIYLRGTAPAI